MYTHKRLPRSLLTPTKHLLVRNRNDKMVTTCNHHNKTLATSTTLATKRHGSLIVGVMIAVSLWFKIIKYHRTDKPFKFIHTMHTLYGVGLYSEIIHITIGYNMDLLYMYCTVHNARY